MRVVDVPVKCPRPSRRAGGGAHGLVGARLLPLRRPGAGTSALRSLSSPFVCAAIQRQAWVELAPGSGAGRTGGASQPAPRG